MKKVLSILLVLTMVLALFTGCGTGRESYFTKEDNGYTVSYPGTDAEDLTKGIDFHTALQQTFLNGDPSEVSKYCKGEKALDKANVIEYSYSEDFTLSISENEDMSSAFTIESENKKAVVENLKTDTTYYVTATSSQGTVELDNIKTADCLPRVINVEGVKNVRDVGGWPTEDGGRIRQGLLYRCGRMNKSDSEEAVIEITEEGIKVMTKDLGIKTDIDLRGVENNEIGSITESPLGPDVLHFKADTPWYPDIFLENENEFREVFAILADESNYPIAFHCNIGTDRTGMVAFLVNGLCGVSEENLYKDYCFSNFADIGGSRSIEGLQDHEYFKILMNTDGDTLPEKIHNFLLNIGVTEKEISSIISIMKG